MSEKRICKRCGSEFIGTGRQVYCGQLKIISCPVCGKEFKDICGPYTHKTCSASCASYAAKQTTVASGRGLGFADPQTKAKIDKTNIDKYGTVDPGNSPEALKKRIDTCQKRYGVDNGSQSEIAKIHLHETSRRKYGVNSASQLQSTKDHVQRTIKDRFGDAGLRSESVRTHKKSTWMKNLGVDNPMKNPDIKAKAMQTCEALYGYATPFYNIDGLKAQMNERYGVDWYTQTDEAKARINKTNLERYGCRNPLNQPWVREKTRQTYLEKYGVDNPGAVPELHAKADQVIMEKYGLPWYLLCGRDPQKPSKIISKINRRMSRRLSDLGISNTFEFCIGRRRYDLSITGTNILIEIDPTYTHNSYESCWEGVGHGLSPEYHIRKTQDAKGYRVIHVFDWDDWSMILAMLQPRIKVYARSCQVRAVKPNDVDTFMRQNHLQGSCHGQIVALGLYQGDQLVQCMTFGKPRYNKHYQWELLRLATLQGYEVTGGASRLWSHAVNDLNLDSVISYCDLAKFTGKVYESIGMKFSHNTSPARVWSYDTQHITDNLLRQRGYDQLFNAHFGKGTSNEELMLLDGWRPVYDCGQAVYTYNK